MFLRKGHTHEDPLHVCVLHGLLTFCVCVFARISVGWLFYMVALAIIHFDWLLALMH